MQLKCFPTDMIQHGLPTHSRPCNAAERSSTLCYNGGICFVMELHNAQRVPGCR